MNQTTKSIALFLAFATLTTMALGIVPRVSAGGPVTGNMLIRIYNDPTQEEGALGTGDIDMNDWPLSSTFITAHATDAAITLNEVAELGMMEFDLNNQLWPTGPITSPRTGSKNGFFNPSGVRDIAAWHFRRALHHLTNKDKYTTTFMGGYGYIMHTMMPVPALEGFTDFSTLTNSTALADAGTGGYKYPYDRAAAIAEFELGGFRDYDADGWREWRDPGADGIYGTGDDGAIEELPNMKVWIRLDDPNRRQAGEDLYAEMVATGIPEASTAGANGLDKRIAERSTCFNAAMVVYDYNIYTGGWSITADPDHIFDFFHSSMGQYSWANNYPGFKNAEFDVLAEKVKYPLSLSDVRNAAIQAQWVANKYVATIWLWASKSVKGYRTGWEGAVNQAGFGTDQSWSFQQMNWIGGTGTSRAGPADTIVYGFKSDISALQVLTSEWLWDWNVLGLIYDTMITRNPYNLPNEVGTLATSWGSTNNYPGWVGKTVVEFTMRTDATFHDGTPVKPADYAYSVLAVKAAGAGNAWNYPTQMDVNKVEIQGNTIRVYYNVASAFAVHWAGFLPVINKDLWDDAIGAGTAAGYSGFIPDDTNGVYLPGTYANPAAIRNYHPWESNAAGDPAKNDLSEDGGWIYSFASYVVGNNVVLSAFTNMYTTISWGGAPITFANFIPSAFHGIGNVNYPSGYGAGQGWYTTDQKIDLSGDLTRIATSAPSTRNGPWGPGPTQYNPDADINGDGVVNVIDLATAGTNYNKKQG
jgi:ABC-type transport system substrate-binding protein